MVPHIYEQLAREHHQTLLREAEQQRRLAEVHDALPPPSSHRLTARLGRYLIILGTRLQGARRSSSAASPAPADLPAASRVHENSRVLTMRNP